MRIAPQWSNRRVLSESRDRTDVRRLWSWCYGIGDPTLWLRADDPRYFDELADGDGAMTLHDGSGRGYSAQTPQFTNGATWETNVQNGLPVIRCIGNTEFPAGRLYLTTSLTIFIVGQLETTGSTLRFFGESGDSGSETAAANATAIFGGSSTGVWQWFHESGTGDNELVNLGASDTNMHLHTVIRDNPNTNIIHRIDGTQDATGGYTANPSGSSGDSARFVIGNNPGEPQQFDGDLCELIIVKRLLSSTERDRAESALMAKWGI